MDIWAAISLVYHSPKNRALVSNIPNYWRNKAHKESRRFLHLWNVHPTINLRKKPWHLRKIPHDYCSQPGQNIGSRYQAMEHTKNMVYLVSDFTGSDFWVYFNQPTWQNKGFQKNSAAHSLHIKSRVLRIYDAPCCSPQIFQRLGKC